jgi:3-oxoacyl-[acyl-carrier protein] reductase
MDKSKYISKVEGHALVLGGSGGIGSEIVRALVANGAQTISFTYGRNKKAADDLTAELASLGVKVYSAAVDQSDETAFKKFLDDAVLANGAEISVAANSIGISPNTPLRDQTLDEWRQVFEVNVFGCFVSTRAIAERMQAKGVKGSIVLITSTNGINSHSALSLHYDSSKSSQGGPMVKVFAEEYALAGIRVNGVAPGWINTPMNDTLPQDERAKEMAKIWSGRFAEPHEVAIVVAFVLGSGGSYITGQNIMVDGGYR